jgi:hypothetical protein
MDYKNVFDKMFPNFPRVRTTDPVTSFEAAESIIEVAPKHYEVILNCLKTNGALGKDGIAALTNLESMQVARRLHELQRMKLIHLTGKTVKSNSNRNEREWSVC